MNRNKLAAKALALREDGFAYREIEEELEVGTGNGTAALRLVRTGLAQEQALTRTRRTTQVASGPKGLAKVPRKAKKSPRRAQKAL